jgi:phytoene desaturase
LKKKCILIGAGFSGLSAACFMAKNGWQVTVLEKHEIPGGRARRFTDKGFSFDMGPSWYWMPDIFDRFFAQFGKKTTDFYTLERLDPSYQVYWEGSNIKIPADYGELRNLFESIEKGSAQNLDKFLQEAAFKYDLGIGKLVHKPGLSVTEFIDPEILKGVFKLEVFSNMKKHTAKYFKDPRLQQVIEFPVLFLGAMANKIPALYSLMNYADIHLGTWYPKGGMYRLVEGMHRLAVGLGVQFLFNQNVNKITVANGKAAAVCTEQETFAADAVIASADYQFTEQKLLEPQWRNYSEAYWNKKLMAPSCIIFYIGLNKKLNDPVHHRLFFDSSFEKHAAAIYTSKTWPADPLFYVCNTTATEPDQAPENGENLFFLIPVAAGLTGDDENLREKYFNMIWDRFEKQTGEQLRKNIVYKKSYGINDFMGDYNAYKGNAYGLANTLLQTAIFKPKCRSKKVSNLFFTGQLTVPGPGVPPALISGELVANLVHKTIN